jgi:hypothetical protein
MTSKIIDAYRTNLKKFGDVATLIKELKTLTMSRDDKMKEVISYYRTIFRNLSSKRKEIGLYKGDKGYFVSQAGISIKGQYQINSESLESLPQQNFIKELVYLSGVDKKMFRQALTKEKYRILDKFMKKVYLLETNDVTLTPNKPKIIKDLVGNDLELKKLSLNYNQILMTINEKKKREFEFTDEMEVISTRAVSLQMYTLNLENMAMLEQISSEVRKLLKKAMVERRREIINIVKFINYIRDKFANQLALEELSR